jgi:FkbM family methyltransferase
MIELPGGLKLSCHPYAAKVYRQLQVEDMEQRQEILNFLSYCNHGMFLFDIGAHFGVFSLAAALSGGSAVAVDPSPTAVHMTAHQASLNRCSEKIRIVRAAVSDANGQIYMLSSGAFAAGYFRVMRGRMRSELTPTPAVTIDELTRQFGAPTHVKIDVEGHEAQVLRGARTTLDSCSPLLFLELHNEMVTADGGSAEAALDELDKLAYATFSLEGNRIPRPEILAKPIIRVLGRRI